MIKYFHKNEVLVVFFILIIIFCHMFFSEYYNILDDFSKGKNNVVYKVKFQKQQDGYNVKFLKDYAMEHLDKVAPNSKPYEEFIEMTSETEYRAKNQDKLNGELYGVLNDNSLSQLQNELYFAVSLDDQFKGLTDRYSSIESIYYRSKNGFLYKWPKSTSLALENKYAKNSQILQSQKNSYSDEESKNINIEGNIFDRDNNYYGIISYKYKSDNFYEFLDDDYSCVIRDSDKNIIYTNFSEDRLDSRALSLLEKVFTASEIVNNKGEILVSDYKYYYIYNFSDGTQLLQFMGVYDVVIRALGETLPIILIGIFYVLFLIFKKNYEISTNKLNMAVAELDESHKKLKIMANTDFLTNLNNRSGFTTEVNKFLSEDRTIIFAMADIDKFKNVNDTYGHEVGDLVLKEFSNTLRENISENDALGRWGGEEFVIAFTSISEENAYSILEEIRKKVLDISINSEQGEVKISSSFGLARHNIKNGDFLNTISMTDEALYYSKNNGRNTVTRYSDLIKTSEDETEY